MHLSTPDAQTFITTYQAILEAMAGKRQKDEGVHWQLIRGRKAMQENPALLDKTLEKLKASGTALDDAALAAIRQMRCAQWIYLRDTRSHSIFLSTDADQAYGVLGLTQGLRDMTGSSGAFIETALLPFKGHIICDGLLANLVWIGSNYRKSFNEDLKRLKAEQRFSASTFL